MFSLTPSPSALTHAIRCSSCNAHFRLWQQIPLLAADPDYYYGEVAKDIFQQMLERAHVVGTSQAIRTLVREGSIDNFSFHYATSPARGGFLPLLNPGPEKRVLDLGCGWGEISLAMAGIFGECYSMDLTKERVALLNLRAREYGITNLIALCGGDRHLPFADQFFDCVLLNGVLEWVAEGQTGPPVDCQKRYLAEVARVLKPGGLVYLAIENRFALRYFLGMREDHSKIRFASIMPRRVADIVSQRIRHRPYRTYTHSRAGYRRLLTATGFGSPNFRVPYPDYRQFEAILQPGSLSDSKAYFQETTASGLKATLKASLLPRLPHSFAIVAAKGDGVGTQPWFERFSAHLACELGWPAASAEVHIRVSLTGSLTLIVRQRSRACVVQIPIGPLAYRELERGYKALQMLHQQNHGTPLPFAFPAPLASGMFEGVRYYVQAFLPHVSQVVDSFSERTAALHRWLRWSAEHRYRSSQVEELSGVQSLIQSLEQWGIPVSDSLREDYDLLLATAGDCRLPCHADLWQGNMIATGDGYALIDWADFQSCGMPLHDAFHYHLYTKGTHDHWLQMLQYAQHGFPAPAVKELAASIRMVLEVMPEEVWSWQRLAALFLLYVANNLIRRTLRRPFKVCEALAALQPLLKAEDLPGIVKLADAVILQPACEPNAPLPGVSAAWQGQVNEAI